jgi:hypothetical protein
VFYRQNLKKSTISNFTEIRPVGDSLKHVEADGRTDMTKILGAFRDYANAPKMHELSRHRLIRKDNTEICQKTDGLSVYENTYVTSETLRVVIMKSVPFGCDAM